mmetsp:Transcript_78809/g.127809  ORF Transcript_78809/g.127809 Transcript_78809/m.127809 type:complete len:150 (+) Transcript_78809:3-452(+)
MGGVGVLGGGGLFGQRSDAESGDLLGGGWELVGGVDKKIETGDGDTRSATLSLVMQEMEREAWRDMALLSLSPPRSAADENLIRERLRQQGASVIARTERLRMLLDSSLDQLFEPVALVAETFAVLDDAFSCSTVTREFSDVETQEVPK